MFDLNRYANDDKFLYQLLSRLQSDCGYFLGNGNGNIRSLWADSVQEQIDTMYAIWDKFPADAKPEWCSREAIDSYRDRMLNYVNPNL